MFKKRHKESCKKTESNQSCRHNAGTAECDVVSEIVALQNKTAEMLELVAKIESEINLLFKECSDPFYNIHSGTMCLPITCSGLNRCFKSGTDPDVMLSAFSKYVDYLNLRKDILDTRSKIRSLKTSIGIE